MFYHYVNKHPFEWLTSQKIYNILCLFMGPRELHAWITICEEALFMITADNLSYEHKNLPHYRVRCSFSSLCLSSSNFPSSHHFSIIPSIWKQPDYGSFVENEFWCYMVVWVLFSFISVFIVHACCPHYYVVTQVVVGMPLILLMV